MFKYKLHENLALSQFSFNPVGDYLAQCGVKEFDRFLVGPQEQDYTNPEEMLNMSRMIEKLHDAFTSKKRFFLQVDSDMDGYTSAAIFYAFVKDNYPEVEIVYNIHPNKEHGIILDDIPIESDVIIIPDAGSSQYDEQKTLAEQGRLVLVMDHHIVDDYYEHDNVILVNNQMGDYHNRSLSGAGVTYKVVDAYCKKYLGSDAAKFMDLAGAGIVADMMDLRDLENNYIIKKGLSNIVNPLLKAVLEKQSFSVSDPTNPSPNDISFYVAPLINAVIRFGSSDNKEQLFRAMSHYYIEETYTRENQKGETVTESFYDMVARESGNARSRQNSQKDAGMKFLCEKIEEANLTNNEIIIVQASAKDDVVIPTTLTGLVAMEICNKYKKPTMVVRPKKFGVDDGLSGSLRGDSYPGFESFKDYLEGTGLVEYVRGHDFAAGVGIKTENLGELIGRSNEELKDIGFGSEFVKVNKIFEDSMNINLLSEFAKYNRIFGRGIEKPNFAFEFKVPKSNINFFGAKKQIMAIQYKGMQFVARDTGENYDIVNDMSTGCSVKFTIVGDPIEDSYQLRDGSMRTEVKIRCNHIKYEEEGTSFAF